jgi:hypothetical protein
MKKAGEEKLKSLCSAPVVSSDGFEEQGKLLIEYFTSLLQSRTASCMTSGNLDRFQLILEPYPSLKRVKDIDFYKAIRSLYTNKKHKTFNLCKSYREKRVMTALIDYYKHPSFRLTTHAWSEHHLDSCDGPKGYATFADSLASVDSASEQWQKDTTISPSDVKRFVQNLGVAFYNSFPDDQATFDKKMNQLIETEYKNIILAKKDPNYNAVCNP